jgi:hypothetical protein
LAPFVHYSQEKIPERCDLAGTSPFPISCYQHKLNMLETETYLHDPGQALSSPVFHIYHPHCANFANHSARNNDALAKSRLTGENRYPEVMKILK